ncbi:MAG: hypothetical protein K2K57_10480 [Oscillospiraceae bacterium]|nr:hypothetical protein [Oscillospiraceae bacterium]
MKKEKTKSRMPQIGEAIFCIAYLVFDLIAAIVFFANAGGSRVLMLFGVLTLVLGGGDAFHLVPRVVKAFHGDSPKVEWWSGLGLMVSSITMTVFYVLLFYIWKSIFPAVSYPSVLPVLIWGSAALRILLCLFPQNNWLRPEGNPLWGIYRNLPFAVTGLCLVILFFISGNIGGYGLWMMSVAIIISFACYFPVVLLAKKKPMVGMLMMPKTMAYIWMICMGLGLIGRVV